LPNEARERVRNAIDELVDEPFPTGHRKLQGREGWRIRVGDYRIIYEVDDDRRVITVLQAGHRRDVYRRG
jgi:mRNA interferase RelE/StbE